MTKLVNKKEIEEKYIRFITIKGDYENGNLVDLSSLLNDLLNFVTEIHKKIKDKRLNDNSIKVIFGYIDFATQFIFQISPQSRPHQLSEKESSMSKTRHTPIRSSNENVSKLGFFAELIEAPTEECEFPSRFTDIKERKSPTYSSKKNLKNIDILRNSK